jgi:hypothetical protein
METNSNFPFVESKTTINVEEKEYSVSRDKPRVLSIIS